MAPELAPVADIVPGFAAGTWTDLMAPVGTTQAVIARIQGAIAKFVHEKDTVEQFATFGAEPVGNSTADFVQFLKTETEQYARVVKEANIKVE